jgi:hypothetical protein
LYTQNGPAHFPPLCLIWDFSQRQIDVIIALNYAPGAKLVHQARLKQLRPQCRVGYQEKVITV